MDGLAVFTISESDRKNYSLNSLWLDYNDFRMTDLALLYDLSPAQWDVVESLDEFFGNEVIPFFLKAKVSTLQDDVKGDRYTGPYPKIAEKLVSFHPGTLEVIQRRLQNIVTGNRKFFRESGHVFRRSCGSSMTTRSSSSTSPAWVNAANCSCSP